jgi:anti-sigma regulatory factor (Ser/Thr protein kinase)
MEKAFPKDIKSLKSIYRFIQRFTGHNRLDPSWNNIINLILEELFVNTVKYNPGTSGKVRIRLDACSDRIVMTLTAVNIDPFDITQTEPFDAGKHYQSMRRGGLGIPLVKHLVDDIRYHYNEETRCSTLTLIRHLEDQHVRHSNEQKQ